MAGNPSFKKRDKERQRQEKQRLKAAKKVQRKQDKANGIVPVESVDTPLDGEQTDPTPPDETQTLPV
jgi:hypothetical protein